MMRKLPLERRKTNRKIAAKAELIRITSPKLFLVILYAATISVLGTSLMPMNYKGIDIMIIDIFSIAAKISVDAFVVTPLPRIQSSFLLRCRFVTGKTAGNSAPRSVNMFFGDLAFSGGACKGVGAGRGAVKANRIVKDSVTNNAKSDDGDGATRKGKRESVLWSIKMAIKKFQSNPLTYCLIPCIAALVGWFTNWLAVQMIFYPIHFRGLNIWRRPGVPLGLIGWQGIVPCKTQKMSESMVDMVTSQLLSISDVFSQLSPNKVATLLSPEVPKLAESLMSDIAPSWMTPVPRMVLQGLPSKTRSVLQHYNHKFLVEFTKDLQSNIHNLFNIKNCVVNQMVLDRSLLGKLFQTCGSAELKFLTNSGLWFGFLLGLIQMIVALFWDNPWSLSVGGGIVGLATNWLALKWIFEPVEPMKLFGGLIVLQGQFLRRQKEVALEFSTFFASKILTSQEMLTSIMTDQTTAPQFRKLFSRHLTSFVHRTTKALDVSLEPEVVSKMVNRATSKLPNHVHVLYPYVDSTLNLQQTLQTKMEAMTSAQFERVLHPIFEEDELTLIIAGAILGFLAGLVQQGLETGQIRLPPIKSIVRDVNCRGLKIWKNASNSRLGKIIHSSAKSASKFLPTRVKSFLAFLGRKILPSQSNTTEHSGGNGLNDEVILVKDVAPATEIVVKEVNDEISGNTVLTRSDDEITNKL